MSSSNQRDALLKDNEIFYGGPGMIKTDLNYSTFQLSEEAASDISIEFEEIESNQIENKYNLIIEEMQTFKENLATKIIQFQASKQKLLKQVQHLKDRKNTISSYIADQELREQKIQDQHKGLQDKIQEFEK